MSPPDTKTDAGAADRGATRFHLSVVMQRKQIARNGWSVPHWSLAGVLAETEAQPHSSEPERACSKPVPGRSSAAPERSTWEPAHSISVPAHSIWEPERNSWVPGHNNRCFCDRTGSADRRRPGQHRRDRSSTRQQIVSTSSEHLLKIRCSR